MNQWESIWIVFVLWNQRHSTPMILKCTLSLFIPRQTKREKGEGEERENTLHPKKKKKLFVFLPICLCGWARNDSPTSRFEISATSAASLSFCQLETLNLDEVGQVEYSLQFLPPPSWPLSFPLLVCPSFQCYIVIYQGFNPPQLFILTCLKPL